MNKQLWFTSSKFSPIPGEEEKTNPGRYGQALAGWIRAKLIAQGHVFTEEPIPEDWGWVVMVRRKPFPLWVGCGREDGNTKRWGVFVEAEPGIFQKLFKRIDTSPAVTALEHELEKIVRAEIECKNVERETL